jgi:hypothetical protein
MTSRIALLFSVLILSACSSVAPKLDRDFGKTYRAALDTQKIGQEYDPNAPYPLPLTSELTPARSESNKIEGFLDRKYSTSSNNSGGSRGTSTPLGIPVTGGPPVPVMLID